MRFHFIRLSLLTLVANYLCPFAYAVPPIIGDNSHEGGQASTCRVLMRDTSGSLLGICSSTLKSSTRIKLAGHCVYELLSKNAQGDFISPSYTVECGYEGTDKALTFEKTKYSGTAVATKGVKFKESRTSSEILVPDSSSSIDTAEISITPPITTVASVVEAKKPDWSKFFNTKIPCDGCSPLYVPKRGAECRIEGFGINPEGFAGVLRTAPISGPFYFSGSYINGTGSSISYKEPHKSNHLEEEGQNPPTCQENRAFELSKPAKEVVKFAKQVKSLTTGGDSGGPLYCRSDAKQKWKLLGVLSTGNVIESDGRGGAQGSSDWESTLVSAKMIPLQEYISKYWKDHSPQK